MSEVAGDAIGTRRRFQGLFGHDGFKLLAVDGNIPAAPVMFVAVFILEKGDAPALQIIHAFVEFSGVGQGQIFAQGAAATCARLQRTRSSGLLSAGMYVLMASMPAAHAPERMMSAFSMMTIFREGSSLAASQAAKQPALPPPMISRSASTTTVSMSAAFQESDPKPVRRRCMP